MRRLLRSLLAAVPVLFLACRADPTAPPDVGGPMPEIRDGAHLGNQHFFFLPPMQSMPTFSGITDGTLSPAVSICEWNPLLSRCGTVIAEFASGGSGTQPVTYDVMGQKYQVDWHTDQCLTGGCTLDPAKTYRIRVMIGAIELGHADVDVVTSGAQLRNVQTAEYIGLVDGRTLPIKFRIEQGAVSVVAPGGGASVGVSGGSVTTADGSVALVFPDGALLGNTTITVTTLDSPPAAGTGTWAPVVDLGPDGSVFANPVTLSLEYQPENLPEGVPPSALALMTFDGTGWVRVPGGSIDSVNNTVSAPISHFSTYSVGIWPNTVNGIVQNSIRVGQTTSVAGGVWYYQVVPQTYCYWVRTGWFSRRYVCNTYTSTYSYSVPNVAVYWSSSAPATASVPVGPTYTNASGLVQSPPVTGRLPGTTSLQASAAGTASGPLPLTVLGVLGLLPRTATNVAGWSVSQQITQSVALANDLPVSLLNKNGFLVIGEPGTANYTYGTQTGAYVIAKGTTSKTLIAAGLSGVGTDTLVASAAGFVPDTAVIRLTRGKFLIGGWPATLAVGDSAPLQVTVVDSAGHLGNLAGTISVAIAAAGPVTVTDGHAPIAAIAIPQRTSATFYLKSTGAGTGKITFTHPDYGPYADSTVMAGAPLIDPFPQAGQQFVLPVLPGTAAVGTAPIRNAGTGVLGGLQVVGTPTICTTGAQLPWLSFAFDSPSAPTNLRVTATVPAGTAYGIYDFCFTLRGTGAPDRPYGVRVSVQEVVVADPPVIDPFPQGRTQHSITTVAGGIGKKDVPVNNAGVSPLFGLTTTAVTNCATGQPVNWLAAQWAATTAPTTLALTATPPGNTAPGTYELCFQIRARQAGAMDKDYGINVVVQPPLAGAQSVCGHTIAGVGYDGTYYYVGEAHDGLLQCLSRFSATTGLLADTRQIFLDHRGMHWVPALGRMTSRTWGGPIYSIDLATGGLTQLASNPTASRPGDEQSQPAVDPDGTSYWILTAGQAERRRLADHGLLKSFPVTTTATNNTIAVSSEWVFVLDGAGVNAYSKVSASLVGRQPLPHAHPCDYYGFGVSTNADRIMYLSDCRHVEVVPVTVTFAEPSRNYQAADLGVLGGSGSSEAYTINGSGRIVGVSNQQAMYEDPGASAPTAVLNPFGDISWAYGVSSSGTIAATQPYSGYLWNPGSATVAGPPPGPFTVNNRRMVFAMNNTGLVLACADNGAFAQNYVWTVATNQVTLIPNAYNFCYGRINDAGVAVANADPGAGGNSRLWNQATQTATAIPSLGGITIGWDLNSAAVAVGSSQVGGLRHAFRFDPATGQTQDLGTLGGNESEARGINDAGMIVGWSINASGQKRGFVYDPVQRRMFELPPLAGHDESQANDINELGVIVGYSAIGGVRRAVRWTAQ